LYLHATTSKGRKAAQDKAKKAFKTNDLNLHRGITDVVKVHNKAASLVKKSKRGK
jgi:hypothetical protein